MSLSKENFELFSINWKEMFFLIKTVIKDILHTGPLNLIEVFFFFLIVIT